MSTLKFYCWVRVALPSDDLTYAPIPFGHEIDRELDRRLALSPKDPNKKPNYVVSGPRDESKPDSTYPAGLWAVVEQHRGLPGAKSVFSIGPAFLSEPAAVDWRFNEGKAWIEAGENASLIAFAYVPT